MPRPEKVEAVEKAAERLSRSSLAIATDYRGLTVAGITQLRRKLGEAGVEYKVVKNTLTGIAARQIGREQMMGLLEGPTAIAFGYGDATETARVLVDYLRASRAEVKVKGALMGDRLLGPAELSFLASLPGRQVLLAQAIGGIKSPLAAIVNVLNAPLANLASVLHQIAEKKKGE